MFRRVALCLVLTPACCGFGVGCSMMDRRPEDPGSVKTETSTSAASALVIDELKGDSLAGAHSAGRSAGAWSSEAREIEGHFNVR